LIDAALADHFSNVGGCRVVSLSDLVDCQATTIRFRTERTYRKAEVLGGILQCDGIVVAGHG